MSAHTAPCSSGAYRAARPSGLARLLAGLALLALCLPALAQRIIEATPDDYRQHLAGLQAGDTLRLAPGTYTDGLPLRRLAGRADAPIIITGPDDGDKALFLGRDGRITISLIDVSHLTLRHLELDGRGTRGHAIVAEGRGTHADHVTLEHLHIHGYDAAQAFNGISTKTPAWNWIIRHNHIHDVGTGLYLGDSDGSAPFVAGLIEGNTIERTLGYNAQFKHQLPRPTLPGMPTEASETIIRHNVFDKSERGNTGNRARPNLLLGHWPLEGAGQNDRYLVHDNLFHQNPTERLFQAEGNVIAHNNRFINLHGRAVSFQAHNDVPRMIEFHDNTVIGRGPAVSLSGAAQGANQTAEGNMIFSETPPLSPFDSDNQLRDFDIVEIKLKHSRDIGDIRPPQTPAKSSGSRDSSSSTAHGAQAQPHTTPTTPLTANDAASTTKGNAPPLLVTVARKMEPGEWRNITDQTTWEGKDEGVSFFNLQRLIPPDEETTGGADGFGWTQNLVYHEGRLIILMMRDQFQLAMLVMEPDGTFKRINQPEGFDRGGRRPFNRLTQDERFLYFSPNDERDRMGYMIRTPLNNPSRFERYGVPIGDRQMDRTGNHAMTYAPEWGRFYAYTAGGKIWSWGEGEKSWYQHAALPADEHGHRLSGYAGLLLWNPVQRELIITGGLNFGNNPDTSHKVYRLTEPFGAPEMLPDRRYPDGRPMRWGPGNSKLIVDPRDGSYLIYTNGILYRGLEAGGRFELYEELRERRPFGQYESYAPVTLIPGTDVLVFLSHMQGVVLHRLKPPASTQRQPPQERLPHQTQRPSSPPARQSSPQIEDQRSTEPEPRQTERAATLAIPRPMTDPEQALTSTQQPEAGSTPPNITESARDLSSSDIRALREKATR